MGALVLRRSPISPPGGTLPGHPKQEAHPRGDWALAGVSAIPGTVPFPPNAGRDLSLLAPDGGALARPGGERRSAVNYSPSDEPASSFAIESWMSAMQTGFLR